MFRTCFYFPLVLLILSYKTSIGAKTFESLFVVPRPGLAGLKKQTQKSIHNIYMGLYLSCIQWLTAIFLVGVQPLFDNVWSAHSPLHTSRAPGAATQDPALVLDSRATRGIFGKPIQEGVPRDATKPEGHAALPHKF
jgi:hypothetical protein